MYPTTHTSYLCVIYWTLIHGIGKVCKCNWSKPTTIKCKQLNMYLRMYSVLSIVYSHTIVFVPIYNTIY